MPQERLASDMLDSAVWSGSLPHTELKREISFIESEIKDVVTITCS
jgi:hypothetical protein